MHVTRSGCLLPSAYCLLISMFDTLVGNERAKETLRRMLAQGRVPSALLLAGEEGLGKKLFALELARALNCRSRRGAGSRPPAGRR